MKAVLCAALLSLTATNAFGVETVTRILKDQTTTIALKLDSASVFCTDRGYGNVQLKVSVPDLDWLAHFDHRVVGESQPCITGGSCSDQLSPGSIIDPTQPYAVVPVRVILSEVMTIDDDAQTCERMQIEEIRSSIRGHTFSHFRDGPQEPVDFALCKLVRGL